MNVPKAFSEPVLRARMRVAPEDFRVEEFMPHTPSGEGEHAWLLLEKREANTDWLAQQLARIAGVRAGDVSYAGLKDRHAVTTQWFSVHLPGRDDPDWAASLPEGVRLIEAARHSRKLRRGALTGNRFVITLRDCEGEPSAVEARLAEIACRGVPNYFGSQRFGRDEANVDRARALFAGRLRERDRHRRGLWISAARSHLFNAVLARRVAEGNWDRVLPGEALILDGSHSFFVADAIDDTLLARLAAFDIHPSGPLWGRGDLPSQGEAAALERAAVDAERELADGLAAERLDQERRALRLRPQDLTWSWPEADLLQVTFSLPAGAYATTVLAEIGDIFDASSPG